MNKVNFNAFQNIRASEEQVAKVLAIPENAEKAPAGFSRVRRGRMIAAAASIVLVAIVGIFAYFLIRNMNKSVISITERPKIIETTAADSTNAAEATDPAGSPSEPGAASTGNNAATLPMSQPATQMTADSSGRQIVIPTAPAATAPASTAPQQGSSTEAPRPVPTQKPVTTPTTPTTDPTQRQTEKPLDPPTFDPTDPPQKIDPTVEPWEPNTEPETEPYTSAPTDAVLTLRTTVKVEELPYQHKIYCRIYDRDKKIVLGDPDRYDESHRAEYTVSGDMLTITFRPSDHGIDVPPGEYAITFHDDNGNLLIFYHITVN